MITSYFKANKRTKEDVRESVPANARNVAVLPPSNISVTDSDKNITASEASKRFKPNNDATVKLDCICTVPISSSSEVVELMSHLQEESWRIKISNHVSKPSFVKLAKFVASER